MSLRRAVRSLARSPGVTLVAVVSLALGIGANTAIFTLIDAVLLRTLPVADPRELVSVTFGGEEEAYLTNPLWEELRERQDVFSGAFAYFNTSFDRSDGGVSRQVDGSWVSGAFFSTLGLAPAAGRLLVESDDQRGCPATTVLGHGFWQSEFGGDPGVVGRTINLDGKGYQILGVAPEGFFGMSVGSSSRLYLPICARAFASPPDGGLDHRSHWFLSVVGRLRDGVGAEAADRRLAALAPGVFGATVPTDWNAEMQQGYLENSLGARPAAGGSSPLRDGYREALLVLMGVVGLVLIIACANIANLLLARAAARSREFAILMALGAGRGRLLRQLLSESLMLSVLGAGAGLLFGNWATVLLIRLISSGPSPLAVDTSLNPRVLGFTAAVAMGTTLIFGVVPAWSASRVQARAAMAANQRTIAAGHSRFHGGKLLVVGQVALSLALVTAAGLLLATLHRLATIDTGFNSEGLVTASFDLRKAGYDEEALAGAREEILNRLRAAPGVRSASVSDIVPLSGAAWNGLIAVDGFEAQDDRDRTVFKNAVTEDFFSTMGAPLRAGREFEAAEGVSEPAVAIINETLARKFFGERNPIGQRIGLATPGEAQVDEYVEVVGVAADAKYRSLREEVPPVLYLPLDRSSGRASLNIAVRAAGPAEALLKTVEAVAAEVHPQISLTVSAFSQRIGQLLTRERVLAMLSGFFGSLALLLTVIGLYGTISYSVTRRRNEIGVRMALGAERARLMRMVLGEVGLLLVVGLVVGVVVSTVAGRAVESLLYGVSGRDPVTTLAAAGILAAVTLAAGALPAWRAARTDPMTALRGE